jgi:hypothetical protein
MFLGDEYVEIVDRIGELAVRVFVDRVSQHQAYRKTLRELLEANREGSHS